MLAPGPVPASGPPLEQTEVGVGDGAGPAPCSDRASSIQQPGLERSSAEAAGSGPRRATL
eukprot:3455111-Rhodomonas_salina.3